MQAGITATVGVMGRDQKREQLVQYPFVMHSCWKVTLSCDFAYLIKYITVQSAVGTPDLEWNEATPNSAEATRVIGLMPLSHKTQTSSSHGPILLIPVRCYTYLRTETLPQAKRHKPSLHHSIVYICQELFTLQSSQQGTKYPNKQLRK